MILPPGIAGDSRASPPFAGVGRRLASLVYDAFLLAAVLLVAGFVVLPFATPASHGAAPYLPSDRVRAFVFAYEVAVAGGYCVGFWTHGRRTLAMKTWRLRLVRANGDGIGYPQALIRYAAAWIGPALALAGYAVVGRVGLALAALPFAWAFVDPERQFLHDRIAGTRVVRD